MKTLLAYIFVLLILFSATGCNKKTNDYGKSDVNPEQQFTETSAESEDAKIENTNEIVDTEYYTISIPTEWKGDCFYETVPGEHYNYSLNFYEKQSHDEMDAGYLFGIDLLTETEDYEIYPSYDVLGSLEVYRIGSYNMIVTYPTDVQFSEGAAKKYNSMTAQISEILKTISFKEECTFSETPIEVIPDTSSETLTMDFYTELCNYVISSCVNYTEWWTNPELSYTDPKHYYLGSITAENYAEKMDEAKKLVDGVYKSGYWEIRHRGYGKLKIGLLVTENNELYFCYED